MDQILAITWLRFRLLANSFRRERGAASMASTVVLALFGVVLSAGMAIGFGLLAHVEADSADHDFRHLAFLFVFWAAVVFGLLVPFVLSAGTQGIDTSSFVSYPLSRRKLFAVTFSSAFLSTDHLIYYPALLTVFVGGVVLPGEHPLASAAFFLVLPLLVVAWACALTAGLGGFLRRRRGKELLAFLGFGLLVIGGLAPAFLSTATDASPGGEWEVVARQLSPLLPVLRSLPPHLAADGLTALHAGESGVALRDAALLLAWAGGGVLSAYFAFTRIALSPSTGGGTRRGATVEQKARERDVTTLLPFVPVEVLAVAAKELRYLLRSVIGRFNLVMFPLFVALIAFVVAPQVESPVLGIPAENVSLYGLALYTVLFANNFVNNSLGWEGDGFKAYFLCPVRLEHVVFGKNLGVWAYNGMLFSVCLGAWFVLVGWPGFAALFAAVLVFLCTSVAFTGIGNFVSFAFPAARSISSMKNSTSAAATLFSFLTIIAIGLLNFALLTLPALLHLPGGSLPFLFALLVTLGIAYRLTLRPASRLLGDRKERILAILEGAEG